MYNFVIEMSMVVSLAVMVYLLTKAVPRITEAGEPVTHPLNAFDRFIAKLPLDKVDRGLHSFFEKFLRKSKIVLSKIDNRLNTHLNRLKDREATQERMQENKERFEKIISAGDLTKDDSKK